MNPFPFILSSPSGGGKTTIARLLLERRTDVG
jgi:guanylate kinase